MISKKFIRSTKELMSVWLDLQSKTSMHEPKPALIQWEYVLNIPNFNSVS